MNRLGCAFLLLLGSACSRTPPEPAPAPVAPAPGESPVRTTATTTSRCIAKLPEVAPKIPDAAMVCPPDPEPSLPKLPRGEMTFEGAPQAPRVEVEIAKTRHAVERGLMFRRSMPENEGMVFKLEGRRDQTFWMQNTCIPLDMLFIDDDGVIVGIVEGAAPLTETSRSVGCPSVFVLELNGGWARRHGIQPGQRVTVPFAAR